jgi:DeoR/GlpR family transcriptional regulator of sugar metabolism
MDCARQVIVVADHTKVGNISFVQMGQIEQVDMLITDSGADPAVIRQLRDAGVKVEVV